MKYPYWSQEVLEQAKEAVTNGLSQRKASAKYGVPQATLSDQTYEAKLKMVLVWDVLQSVVQQTQLMQSPGNVAKTLQLKTPWKKAPGPDWCKGFKSCNTDIIIRKPEGLSYIRSRAVNPTVVGSINMSSI